MLNPLELVRDEPLDLVIGKEGPDDTANLMKFRPMSQADAGSPGTPHPKWVTTSSTGKQTPHRPLLSGHPPAASSNATSGLANSAATRESHLATKRIEWSRSTAGKTHPRDAQDRLHHHRLTPRLEAAVSSLRPGTDMNERSRLREVPS
jgi:hypothetical protein